VADEGAAAEWEPALREGLGQPIEIVPPVRPPELAALTARRAAHAGAGANLLPAEFSTRYQQQFIDRLWIRGLFAVGALYVAGVLIYFVLLGVLSFQTHRVEGHVADLGSAYTNAIRLEDRYKVLKDREDLKFAALDCWEALAELMPDTITLEDMNFNEGKRLSLRGTAPNDQVQQLINFQAALRKATKEGEQLFDSAKGDSLNWHVNPGAGAQTVSWSFGLELKRTEME